MRLISLSAATIVKDGRCEWGSSVAGVGVTVARFVNLQGLIAWNYYMTDAGVCNAPA